MDSSIVCRLLKYFTGLHQAICFALFGDRHEQDPAQEAVMPLLNDLSVNIKLMQKMVRLIGTKNDTQEERRKFEEMSKESRGIIQQATRLMGRSTTLNKVFICLSLHVVIYLFIYFTHL